MIRDSSLVQEMTKLPDNWSVGPKSVLSESSLRSISHSPAHIEALVTLEKALAQLPLAEQLQLVKVGLAEYYLNYLFIIASNFFTPTQKRMLRFLKSSGGSVSPEALDQFFLLDLGRRTGDEFEALTQLVRFEFVILPNYVVAITRIGEQFLESLD